jgi:hypothetical protein
MNGKLGVKELNLSPQTPRVDRRLVAISAALLGIATLFPLAGDASAAPSWAGPVNLGFDDSVINPSVAINASGAAEVAWGNNGAIEDASGNEGRWQAARAIASPGFVADPSVGLDRSGNAIAFWQDRVGVWAARKPASGENWQAPVQLGGSNTHTNQELQLVVDPTGDALAVWPEGGVVHAAVMSSATGQWGPTVQLSPQGDDGATDLSAAVNDEGEAIVAWREYDDATSDVVESASSLGPITAGAWGAPVIVSSTEESAAENLSAATNDAGDAVVTWEKWDDSYTKRAVMGASRPGPHGAWSTPVRLAKPEDSAWHPRVALDGTGTALAVWEVRGEEAVDVEAAEGSVASNTWREPVELATTFHGPELKCEACPPRPFAEPQVALNEGGRGVVLWSASKPELVQAAIWEAASDNPWQPPQNISTVTGFAPRVAINPDGDAIGAWLTATSSPTVQANVLASAPLPLSLSASLSRKQFRTPTQRAHLGRRQSARHTRTGTSINFVLSRAARLSINIKRKIRSGRGVGMLTRRQEPRGPGHIHFNGYIGHRPLHPGRYSAVLRAKAGTETAGPVRLSFRVTGR